MKRTAAALAFAGILAAVLFSAGCSGPGVTAASVRGASVQEIAADHLSAVLLVKSWFKILYQKAGEGGDCEPTFNFEDLPDGSFRMWGTNSDCSEYDWTIHLDESGTGTLTSPDGSSVTMTWGVPVWVGGVVTQDVEEAYGDGARIAYTIIADFDAPGTPQTWDGTATLPDGRAMTFLLNRVDEVEDRLTLALPDGSELEVRVPLTWAPGAPFWPVFSKGANGTFTAPSTNKLDFQLSAEGERWDRWRFASSDGYEGAFTLGEDLDGSGQLTEGGRIVAALRWHATGLGTLDLLAAGSAEVTPSAAARDFQIDQWVATVAAMGPAPMY